MAESTLALAYNELTGEIGDFLGYGRGSANGDTAWDTTTQKAIDSCTKSALRMFYYPQRLDGEPSAYEWSFLRPETTLTFASAASTVALPDDYNGVIGQIDLSASSTIQWYPLDVTGIGRVNQQYAQYPTTTGRPQMVAVNPKKGTGAAAGQRFELKLWPIADQDYTLRLTYSIHPDYLSGAYPYAYGGAAHAETLRAAGCAAAELFRDNMRGPMWAYWEVRLAASIDVDRRHKPQLLGYNRDLSDLYGRRYPGRRNQHGESVVTVNGVTY